MRWTRIAFFFGVLLVAAVSATALPAAQSCIFCGQHPAKVHWSVDGSRVGGTQLAPLAATGFHAGWTTGGAVLVWTKFGKVNSGAITSPSGANDVRADWSGGGALRLITAAFWSQNGTDLAPIPIAEGSNGLYIKLTGAGVFDSAFWSGRRGVLRPVVPAPGANDVHLVTKPVRFSTDHHVSTSLANP